MTDYEELKKSTCNTNGLSDFRKRKDVLDFPRKQKGNIFLYKKHWPSNAENIVRSQWGCKCVVAGHHSSSKAVAILFKK